MIIAEYIEALDRLPTHYRELPWDMLNCACIDGNLLIAHPCFPPHIYDFEKRSWVVITRLEGNLVNECA